MAVANGAVANVATDVNTIPNMEDLIAQVLEKQLSMLESVIYNAVKGVLAEINATKQHIGAEPEMQETMVCDPEQSDCVTLKIQRLWMPEGTQHELHTERNSDSFNRRATLGTIHGGREFAFAPAAEPGIFWLELEVD